MNEQLKLVRKLHDIDSRSVQAHKELQKLTEHLAPAVSDLKKLEDMLAKEKTKLDENDKWRAEQEQMIQDTENAMLAAKTKLQQSQNARDFHAATREIENKKRMVSDRQKEVKRVVDATEDARKALLGYDENIQKLRDHVAAEEAKIHEQHSELKERIETESSVRGEVTSGMEKPTLTRYEKVRKFRGSGMATIVDHTCQGCYISLPPQLVYVVAREETIEACPRCQRMLFVENPEEFAASA